MHYQEMRDLLHRHFAGLLASRKLKMQEDGPLNALEVSSWQTGTDLAAEAITGRNFLSLVTDDTELLGRFIEHYSLPLQAGTAKYDQFTTEFYKAYRDFSRTVLTENGALSRYDFDSEKRAPVPSRVRTGAATSLRQLAEKYTAEEIRVGRWVKRSEDQNRQHLNFLVAFVGEGTDVHNVTADHARAVKDTLLRLPRNMNKNPRTRGKVLEEVLAMDLPDKLNIRTVNLYLQTYSRMFTWALAAKLVDENHFTKAVIREKKRKAGKRQAFSHDQIRTIEAALLSEEPAAKPKEAHRWASLIAIYTGARLNEVCQLTVGDVKQHEGVWCFDLNDEGEGKHLKNEASVRIVPIHSRLIELGVLTYVETLRAKKAPKLFPEYTYTPNYGWGKNLSVWFNTKLLVTLGLKTKQLVLHSLRHTMTTRLLQADVQEPIVQGIVGHTRKGVTQQHYFDKGYKIEQLKEAIEKY
jgi:integrase